jgi:hypothetical protein
MGPLPNHRVEIGAIFQLVAIDLFGPIEYQGIVNKRQVGKGWGVVFVCTTTSAVHIEFMDTYSTDSFLMALQCFMCLRGTPSRFQSDRGEQLVAAAKQVTSWDFKEVTQWAGKKGIEWILVPTGGQHFNGQAERMIGLIKRQIWRSFEGRKYSHEETITILQEATQVINSRPLGRNPWPEGEPLCPQDLMLGRARCSQPPLPPLLPLLLPAPLTVYIMPSPAFFQPRSPSPLPLLQLSSPPMPAPQTPSRPPPMSISALEQCPLDHLLRGRELFLLIPIV